MHDKLAKYVASRADYTTLVKMTLGNVGFPEHLHDEIIRRGYPQDSVNTLAELGMRGFAAEPCDLMRFAEQHGLRSFNGQPAFSQADVDKLAAELLAKRQFTASTKKAIRNKVTMRMRLNNAARAVAEEIERRAACGDGN